MPLYKSSLLRRMVLPLFARFNPGDVTIRHHFTGEPFRIHSYRHKGYWYHGRRRGEDTMRLFRRFLADGATVLDVGGHTGYVAVYLASLVGPGGRVFVFEPGVNNLPYLKHNTRQKGNITVIEKALGARKERRTFYIEGLTGQNNSFVRDFAVLRANKTRAHVRHTRIEETVVDVITLDAFCREQGVRPDFIKIDVEGFELESLQGAASLLREVRPMMMVEIQAGHRQIVQLARSHGYRMFTPQGEAICGRGDFTAQHINTFWLHEAAHGDLLDDLQRRGKGS